MTKLLALDPPAERAVSCTGWALGEFSETQPFVLLRYGAVEGGFDGFCASELPELLKEPDIVVCEKWVTYNPAGDSSPQLTEGVIRYLRPDVVLQPSGGKNTLVPDEALKRLGFWFQEGHHKDTRESIRHALLYLASKRHLPTLREMRNVPSNR